MHNQHRSPDPTKIERATATSTVALFFLFFSALYKAQLDQVYEGGFKLEQCLRFSSDIACFNTKSDHQSAKKC
jgi:hypothetical protein